MPTDIQAFEAEEFATAIQGLDVEYVRTGPGNDPCRMTLAGTDDVQFSVGSMGFPAISRSEIPGDVGVFVLIDSVGPGGRYCGVDLDAGRLHFYAPGTSFVGIETTGLAASILTVSTAAIDRVAEGHADTVLARSVEPLVSGPAVERLTSMLANVRARPARMDDARWGEHVLEAAVASIVVDSDPSRSSARGRLSSRAIVARSLDFVESTRTYQPTLGQLCRAAGTSQSRLRRAFVDMFHLPPTKYFQHRLLSRFRNELLLADPAESSVTSVASSLGITEFGRVAGRYHRAFGELPNATLRRRPGATIS